MKQQIQVPDMVKWVLGILVVLWLVGLIQLPILNTAIFSISGRAFTVQHLLILLILGYVLRFLPGILQTIVAVFIGIWLLATFIFPSFGGFVYIMLIILVLYLLFSFV